MSGLKPQVQSAPFSLDMVSTLLVDVLALLLEPGLELEPAPALQPAASMPAATMTPYLVRRLMPFVLYCCLVLTGRGAGSCAQSPWLPHAQGWCLRAKQPSRLPDVCVHLRRLTVFQCRDLTTFANFVRTVS